MSKHTCTTGVEICEAQIDVEFHFNFVAGTPQQGPTYASGGEPATAPEVEITSAVLLINTQADGKKWDRIDAPDWLVTIFQNTEHLIDALLEEVEDNDGPDPDAAFEARREEE